MSRRAEYALAIGLQLAGSAALLLLSTRTWAQVRTPRPTPLPADHLALTGRDLDSAGSALALVGLAGVVAVLATRGLLRRLVGLLVAVAGVLAAARCAAAGHLDAARALRLVEAKHPNVSVVHDVAPSVRTDALPVTLSIIAAALMALAGLLVAVRGGRWAALSARYESPATGGSAPAAARADSAAAPDEGARARRQAGLWNALDRGEDPTDGHAG